MAVTQIASLTQVKQYLRIPNPSSANPDDATIQILMNAATKAIEAEIGSILPEDRVERHDGGNAEIWLRKHPVLYIRSVEEGWGYYNQNLDDQLVNSQPALSIWAYSLDIADEGLVTRRGPGNVLVPFVSGRNNIRVAYVAGRQTVPPEAVLPFCELVSIWYRQSQLRLAQNGGSDGVQFNAVAEDTDRKDGSESLNYGVPLFIIEMLKSERRRPIIG